MFILIREKKRYRSKRRNEDTYMNFGQSLESRMCVYEVLLM